MEAQRGQLLFYIGITLTTLVLRYAKSKDGIRSFFGSSIEIIAASLGYIYAIVEKNPNHQYLYVWCVLFVLLGWAFEIDKDTESRPHPGKLFANFSLMIIAIFVPMWYLYGEKLFSSSSNKIATQEIVADLERTSDKAANLKIACSEYLSNNRPFDGNEFSSRIKNLTDDDITKDEAYLLMACYQLSKSDSSRAEKYLSEIDSTKYKTDVAFIRYKLRSPDIYGVSKIKFIEEKSWLGIDNERIKSAKIRIDSCNVQTIKVLILDASAGRRGKGTTVAGLKLKEQFLQYRLQNVKVEPFDYINTEPRVKIHISSYYSKNLDKKGVFDLCAMLKKKFYKELTNPGNYLNGMADAYDIVVVTSK